MGMAMTHIRKTKVYVVVIEELWGGWVQRMRGCGDISVLNGEGRVGNIDGGRGVQGRGISGIRRRSGSR